MEDRFIKLEASVSDLKTEMKLMNATLSIISETLSELKSVSRELGVIRTTQALTTQKLTDATARGIRHTTRFEEVEKKVREIDKSESQQGIKISQNERFIWFVVTVVVGFAVHKLKGL